MENQTVSQNKKILQFLKEGGYITPLKALEYFGCLRLAARVSNLIENGHDVRGTMVKDLKTGKRYKQYYLHTAIFN